MSLLSQLVDSRIVLLLRALQPPILTPEELFCRDTVTVCKTLQMTIQEFTRLKLDVARKVLSRGGTIDLPLLSGETTWKALPSAIPALNTEVKPLRTTGLAGLDALVAGGFPAGSFVSIVGGSGAGKTHIAASAASACALQGMRVTVISSCNDIQAKRIQTSLETIIRQSQNPARPYTQAELQDLLLFALSHVTVVHCFDLWSLIDTLSNIKDRCLRGAAPDLLVIDCMHHYVAPLMMATAGLNRSTSMSSALNTTGGAGPVTTATAANTATELLNSLLCQAILLLRSLTGVQCTVVLTNTPAGTTSGALRRLSSAVGGSSADGGTGMVEGLGMGAALLDMVDISLWLERADAVGARERAGAGGSGGSASGLGRGSWGSAAVSAASVAAASGAGAGAGGAGGAGGAKAAPTVIRAAIGLRPPYMKASPTHGEFVIL